MNIGRLWKSLVAVKTDLRVPGSQVCDTGHRKSNKFSWEISRRMRRSVNLNFVGCRPWNVARSARERAGVWDEASRKSRAVEMKLTHYLACQNVRSPEVLVSKQIDYELAQYDEYMERAQHLMEGGSTAEAGAFEALADLCYEKARVFQGIEDIATSRQTGPSAA